jgi:HD-like signal output (HDOD) protein
MNKEGETELLQSLESGYSLPALSPVALKLVEMATDENRSAADLARLIEQDPSLAVRLLRLANSAFFASAKRVATLQQAVVRLGFQRMRVMALTISLRDTFPMGKLGPLDCEQFWRASLYRAVMARSLAGRLGACDPDEAFVAGLILEIGLLILFDLRVKGGDDDAQLELADLEGLLAWERSRYGLDHRHAAAVALEHWQFPGRIVECQLWHGPRAVGDGAPALAGVCERARRLALPLLQGSTSFQELTTAGEGSVGLDPEVLSEIMVHTFEEVEEIAEHLRVELDRERDLLDLMEKANQALSRISDAVTGGEAEQAHAILPSFETLPSSEATSRTLQAVAHEIRNPLLTVGWFAKRLAASLDPETEAGQYAKVILEEALRLEGVLSRMA